MLPDYDTTLAYLEDRFLTLEGLSEASGGLTAGASARADRRRLPARPFARGDLQPAG